MDTAQPGSRSPHCRALRAEDRKHRIADSQVPPPLPQHTQLECLADLKMIEHRCIGVESESFIKKRRECISGSCLAFPLISIWRLSGHILGVFTYPISIPLLSSWRQKKKTRVKVLGPWCASSASEMRHTNQVTMDAIMPGECTLRCSRRSEDCAF